MYLYTDRVYNHKIDDYINSTSIKQLGDMIFATQTFRFHSQMVYS